MASSELTDIITMLRSRPVVENPPVADMRKGFDVLASKFPPHTGIHLHAHRRGRCAGRLG